MRLLYLSITAVLVLTSGCGHSKTVCDQKMPPPECQTVCNPQAPINTCPVGYYCGTDNHCNADCTPGGNECGTGQICNSDGRCQNKNGCTGIGCDVVDCAKDGKPPTTLKGTVYAPNGTLPLYGINVYVPTTSIHAMPAGAICSRCGDQLDGTPIAKTTTDAGGNFALGNVPSGQNIPLVITSGKWRRQITIPSVTSCTDTALAAADTTLPKTQSQGDIPKIAVTTGNADSLECLIRKIGIADSEITTSTGPGRVHLYAGNGVDKFVTGFPGGSGTIPPATPFWASADNLKPYDIVILSCEGDQNPDTKPQPALDAMKAYADLGGRVFASHWHNIWIGGAYKSGGNYQRPAVWDTIATWSSGSQINSGLVDLIDEMQNPKGPAFAEWMLNPAVMGSTVRDEIQIENNTGRTTCDAIDPMRAERWTYIKGGNNEPQNFQFTTPNEQPTSSRCGKVVFSDMHVSGGPIANQSYPNSCAAGGAITALTAQEKALIFMIFDLASCVGPPIP
jgi:hypothetical protein